MFDVAWLSQEARTLHSVFSGVFYVMITTLLLLGVLVEYFKWPLGGVPAFGSLVGRAIVAVILMHSYPEITNALASATDTLAERVGGLNNFRLVLSRMGERLETLTASWVSVKETLIVCISFVGFFLLYLSVYVAQGIHLFAWTLCYVFSPIMIALFVLPATAGATRSLFQTLFEVSCWKIVWSCLATLLWSMALSEINKPQADVNVISVICLNLLLAGSLLATPWVVHGLASSGLTGFSRSLGALAVGSVTFGPGTAIAATKATTRFRHRGRAETLGRE